MNVTKQYPTEAFDTRPLYLASEWWDAVLRDDDPMPVSVAFDRLREQCDTDDTGWLKRLIYAAGGERMDRLRIRLLQSSSESRTSRGCRAMGEGDFDHAWDQVGWFADHCVYDNDPYLPFSKEFKRVLDVCRAVEELP